MKRVSLNYSFRAVGDIYIYIYIIYIYYNPSFMMENFYEIKFTELLQLLIV